MDSKFDYNFKNQIYNPRNSTFLMKDINLFISEINQKLENKITKFSEIPLSEILNLKKEGIHTLILLNLWEKPILDFNFEDINEEEVTQNHLPIYNFKIAKNLGGNDEFLHFVKELKDYNFEIGIHFDFNNISIDSEIFIDNPNWFINEKINTIYRNQNTQSYYLSDDIEILTKIDYEHKNHFVIRNHDTNSIKLFSHSLNENSEYTPFTAQIDVTNPNLRNYIIEVINYYAKFVNVILLQSVFAFNRNYLLSTWYDKNFPDKSFKRVIDISSKNNLDLFYPNNLIREIYNNAENKLLLIDENNIIENYDILENDNIKYYNMDYFKSLILEDNEKFKDDLFNILKFDRKLLLYFVNYCIGIDINQFNSHFKINDKLYGIIITLLGIPGQNIIHHEKINTFNEDDYNKKINSNIEIFRKKLKLKFENEINFMVDNKSLYNDIYNFNLYQFFASNGKIDHNIISISNFNETNKSIIVFNNQYLQTSGWIKHTFQIDDELEVNNETEMNILDALKISDNDGYIIFRDQITNLEYIRSNRDIRGNGLYIKLNAYKYHLFVDIQEIIDNLHIWKEVNELLDGEGIENLSLIYENLVNNINSDDIISDANKLSSDNILSNIKNRLTKKSQENSELQQMLIAENYSKGVLNELLKLDKILDNQNQELKQKLYDFYNLD